MSDSKENKDAIPEHTAEIGRAFVDEVLRRNESDDDPILTGDFGHAVRGVASIVSGSINLKESEAKQLETLKKHAQKLVDEFGENIIPLLRDDLRIALSIEDLTPETSE